VAWQSLRTIVECLDVSEYVDLYTEQFPRFGEAWEGLKWLLSRTPALAGSLRRTGEVEYRLYVLAGDRLAGTPDIWVTYTFTDDQVSILALFAKAQAVGLDEAGDVPSE
jgi:hypothetical protein